METFRYLKREGDKYVLPNQKTLSLILGGLCLVFGAWACLHDLSNKASIFIGAIVILLAILIFMRMNHKIIFDPINRTITFPKLRNSEGRVYSFDEFSNFKMVKIKQYFVMTTNNWLQMEFATNGKHQSMQIRQYGPNAKNAQYLIEEIETVMGINGTE